MQDLTDAFVPNLNAWERIVGVFEFVLKVLFVFPFILIIKLLLLIRRDVFQPIGTIFVVVFYLLLLVGLIIFALIPLPIWIWFSFLVGFLTIAGLIKFINRQYNNPIVSAFSILCTTIFIFILLGGACFEFLGGWMPYVALVILYLLFGLSVAVYIHYFRIENDFDKESKDIKELIDLFQFNFLEGFGGDTFSEFATGIGVLVTLGIYTVYSSGTSTYWWAGQVGALISVMAAAAYVQRYVLEMPSFSGDRDWWGFLKKAGQNFINCLAVILIACSILFPTLENVQGLEEATRGDGWWWLVFLVWLGAALIWFIAAIEPFGKLDVSDGWQRNDVPPWPRPKPAELNWSNRDSVSGYLIVNALFTSVFIILIAVSWVSTDGSLPNAQTGLGNFWNESITGVLGIIASLLFVIGIFFKWIFNSYDAGEDQELKMLLVFKDVALFVTGSLIFVGQIVNLDGNNLLETPPFSTIYIFILGMMAYSFLIGILIGAYKWTMRYRPES